MAYRFGEFILDQDTRQLLLGDAEVHLSPKGFDLLALLLANRARAVSKSELQQRLWPNTFVDETNLASLIAEVRRALRDPAAQPRFIRTVYGFGYRFVGEVTLQGTSRGSHHGRFWLMVIDREIPLMEGANVIGRTDDAAIRIDSPGLSRRHARIVVADGQATLEDLGSKNGTRLNGQPVAAPTRLSDGDAIQLGAIRATFRVMSEMSPTETLIAERS